MRARAFAAAALVLLLAAACTGAESAKPAFRSTVAAAECPADIEVLQTAPHSCGYLSVLEDRARPEGPTLRLLYLRVQPAGGRAEPEPIAAVGEELAQSPSYDTGIVESSNRELILLEQRGTGHSKPSLACPEVDAVASDLTAGPLSSDAVQTVFRDAIAACRARLTARGVNPEAYTLAAAAEDLEDLRRALGVSTWNLVSWGTASRLLLEYTRLHPQPIRALVLGSPQFPQRDPISEAAGDFNDAFRALIETCGASKECDREYPNLQRAFSQAVAALERSPISASVRGKEVVVDGAALARVVRSLISSHDAEAVGQVPRIVYRALDGDVGAVASELASDPGMCIGYLPRCDEPLSLGAYLSFTCPDASTPPHGADVYAEAFGEADPYLAACRAWGVERNDQRPAPVTTDVPSLVLRGDYDAFSPLDLVQQVNTTMPRAHVVLAPHFGHDVFGVDCLRDARNTWLLHPRSDPDYSPCLHKIPAPTFAIRSGVGSLDATATEKAATRERRETVLANGASRWFKPGRTGAHVRR
jgi:pimeloyl-ACP methyl ester carboxylesterase